MLLNLSKGMATAKQKATTKECPGQVKFSLSSQVSQPTSSFEETRGSFLPLLQIDEGN